MKPQMGEYPVIVRLPVSYYRDIGRIVFKWALLESVFRDTVYALLRLDRKRGRLAIRSSRPDEMVTLICDLMSLSGLTTTVETKPLIADLKLVKTARDHVAHGLWVRHPGTSNPVLQFTSGSFPEKPGAKAAKTRVYPQSMEVEPGDLGKTVRDIDILTATAEKLRDEIAEQLARPPTERGGQ